MRLRARVDQNQREIVLALRKAGCAVYCTHQVGHGFPDLLVRTPRPELKQLEVKEPGERLTLLSEAVTQRRPCQKPAPRVVERAARVSAERKREQAAKAERWKICGGKCEYCGRRIARVGLESLHHAICHHVIKRVHLSARQKWAVSNLRYICVWCDKRVHG
jgi:hypothetical protein